MSLLKLIPVLGNAIIGTNTPAPATLRSLLSDNNGGKGGDLFLPSFQSNIFLEASIVPEADHVKVYFTSTISDTVHYVCLATATTMQGPFTIQGICAGHGNGGAPSGRCASSSGVFKAEGYYWMYALNGYGIGAALDRNIYLYRSATGMPGTWEDLGVIFTKDTNLNIYGFGNTTIWPEKINGVYIGIIDTAPASNIWEPRRYTAPALTGPWTHTHTLESMRPVAGNMFGGNWLDYYQGRMHTFYHYGSGEQIGDFDGNLPTYLAYAYSDDLGITWIQKEVGYLKLEALPYGPPVSYEDGTSQIADVCVMEVNGELWHLAEYVENTSPISSQIRRWRTGKTKAQFYNAIFTLAT